LTPLPAVAAAAPSLLWVPAAVDQHLLQARHTPLRMMRQTVQTDARSFHRPIIIIIIIIPLINRVDKTQP